MNSLLHLGVTVGLLVLILLLLREPPRLGVLAFAQ